MTERTQLTLVVDNPPPEPVDELAELNTAISATVMAKLLADADAPNKPRPVEDTE